MTHTLARPRLLPTLTLVSAVAVLGLSAGCTANVKANLTVPASQVATQAAAAPQKQVGTANPPALDCGTGTVDLVNGTVVNCTLTDGAKKYPTTVTISDVNGTDYHISAQVSSTPAP